VRETAGCAAVFMVMGQMATNPQITGGDPLAGALGGMFARSFTQKGRGLYARAAEQARRDRLPPEAVFEAGRRLPDGDLRRRADAQPRRRGRRYRRSGASG
jgi:hypothetical protein